MSELPEIRNRIKVNEVFINATPDGNYALRILQYYRNRCNEKWIVDGFSENERRIYDIMNNHQDERSKELDRAIAKLMKDD